MPAFLDLLLPPACAACGRAGSILCDPCTASLRAPDPGAFVVADAGALIGDAAVLSLGAFSHAGPMRSALSRLKYAGAARVCVPLAAAAAPALGRLLAISGPRAVLVPVPVHAARRRQRGYNQAELLARALARASTAAMGGRLQVVDALERRAPTERQHRLDRAARLRNLRNAIRVRPGTVVPADIIVVDDILTTAATIEACASALREAGAASVLGFAIAREV